MSAGLFSEAKQGIEQSDVTQQLHLRSMKKTVWDTQAAPFIEKRLSEFATLQDSAPLSLQRIIDMSQELLSLPDNDVGINATFDHPAMILGLIYYSAADLKAYGKSEWGGIIEFTFERAMTISEEAVDRLFQQLKPVASDSSAENDQSPR